jgi:hypothetical protein
VIVDWLCFICPCISLFKLYFYTNLIGCMCFYEANTTIRVVREYPNPNPKFQVTRFFGYCKTRCNFGYRFSKPEILNTRITGPEIFGKSSARSKLAAHIQSNQPRRALLRIGAWIGFCQAGQARITAPRVTDASSCVSAPRAVLVQCVAWYRGRRLCLSAACVGGVIMSSC